MRRDFVQLLLASLDDVSHHLGMFLRLRGPRVRRFIVMFAHACIFHRLPTFAPEAPV